MLKFLKLLSGAVYEATKEEFSGQNKYAVNKAAEEENTFQTDKDDLLTGIPKPDQWSHINHRMYHPELYES